MQKPLFYHFRLSILASRINQKHERSTNPVKDLYVQQRVLSFYALPLSSRALHYGVWPCHVCMSCLVWSWLDFPYLSYLALHCRVMYCLVLSCLALPCLASPRRALPCLVVFCLTLPPRVSSRHEMTCHLRYDLVLFPSMSARVKIQAEQRGPRGSPLLLRLNFGRQDA